MIETKTIKGYFVFQKFRSDNYAIYSFKHFDKSEKNIVVKGNLPHVEKKVLYEVSGVYVEHKSYGLQFEAYSAVPAIPDKKDQLIKYLSGKQFSGIGKKTATQIVDALGVKCINVIKDDKAILETLDFLSEKHKQSLIENISSPLNELEENYQFFIRFGLSYNKIEKINFTYGNKAREVISENPYKLVYDVVGVNFKDAEIIAHNLGDDIDHNYRNEALIYSKVKEYNQSSGCTYIMYDKLYDLLCNTINEFDYVVAFKNLLHNEYLFNDNNRIYTNVQYDAENTIALRLPELLFKRKLNVDIKTVNKYIKKFEGYEHIKLSLLQREAIANFFNHNFSIVTGGPGTGKTTIIKAMVEIFKIIFPNNSIISVAPTGRASKRLRELCNVQSTTLHSLLAFNLEDNSFKKNEKEPLEYDTIIIDEASMIDSTLFSAFLKACNNIKKICIIGDVDQLPSVGPGQVLKDLIDSNAFSVIRLQDIYRQKQGSDIINLANNMRKGFYNPNEKYKEIAIKNIDKTDYYQCIRFIINNAITKGYSFNDIQILAPIYRGICGIDNLNILMQAEFNPPKGQNEIEHNGHKYRINDFILQLKNQPDDNVFNGDIGILVDIEYNNNKSDDYTLIVDYDSNLVEYKKEDMLNITHAFCISIHKSQGSEYPIVILVLSSDARFILNRKLIYTAVTRAKNSLIILTEDDLLEYSIQKVSINRDTNLIDKIYNSINNYK